MIWTFERGDHVELAAHLINRLPGTSHVYADGALWAFRGQVFERVEDDEASRVVQGFAGAPIGDAKRCVQISASDVRGAIALAGDTLARPAFFDAARPGVAFENGFFDLASWRLVAHAPEQRARYAYPFPLLEREPRRWCEFLAETFRGDADAAEKTACLQEFGGACMLGIAARYQQCLVQYGDGRNGKGVVQRVLVEAMPPGSVTAVAPQFWGDQFQRALLAGKRLNAVGELPSATIGASSAFKAIIAGDSLSARQVKGRSFTFVPTAGHVFSANPPLPSTNDQSFAFWRRMIVVEFRNRPARANPNLSDEIIASELPAVVGWYLQGARRLVERGAYTIPSSSARAVDAWRATADPVALFMNEKLERLPLDASPSQGTAAAALYETFRKWAGANGYRSPPANEFGVRLQALGIERFRTKTARGYLVRVTQGDALVTDPSADSPMNSVG